MVVLKKDFIIEFGNCSGEFKKAVKKYHDICQTKLKLSSLSEKESSVFFDRIQNLNREYNQNLVNTIEETFKCHVNKIDTTRKNSSTSTLKGLIKLSRKKNSESKNFRTNNYSMSNRSSYISNFSISKESFNSNFSKKASIKYNIIDPPYTIQEQQNKSCLFTYMASSINKGFYSYEANSKTLKEYNSLGNVIRPINIIQIGFKKFGPFCTNSEGHICFTDNKNELIVIDSFQNICQRVKDVKPLISDVAFDDENKEILYISDTDSDSIHIWDLKLKSPLEKPFEISRFTITRPLKLFSYEKHLIVLGSPSIEYKDIKHSEISQINPANCIYIIKKNDTSNQRTIEFADWLKPTGMYRDDYDHLYTIAYKLDPNKAIVNVCFFILDLNGNRLKELVIENLTSFKHVLILHNKVVFSDDDKIRGLKTCSLRYSNRENSLSFNSHYNSELSLQGQESIQTVFRIINE